MNNSSKLFDINYKLQFLNNYMQSKFMQLKNGKKPPMILNPPMVMEHPKNLMFITDNEFVLN